MMIVKRVKDWENTVQTLGRVYCDQQDYMYLGWTDTGVKFRYVGCELIALLEGICGTEKSETEKDREIWPYLAVFVDDEEEPYKVFPVNKSSGQYLLYSSEKEEEHIIILRKLTENPKGKIKIIDFLGDGQIKAIPKNKNQLRIEFIGDSITCGFGNMSEDKDRAFYAEDENGWMSHAAIAGRMLNAEVELISYSGISVTTGMCGEKWPIPDMASLYPYTDCMVQEYLHEGILQEWNFMNNPKDVVVLNLGTNDAVVIDQGEDISGGIRRFEEDYYHLLEMIRCKNGKDTWIVCALGPLDYYLYDNIQKVERHFAKEKQDLRITCFKYGKTLLKEGIAPCNHPTVQTQMRMAEEISGFIKECILKEYIQVKRGNDNGNW